MMFGFLAWASNEPQSTQSSAERKQKVDRMRGSCSKSAWLPTLFGLTRGNGGRVTQNNLSTNAWMSNHFPGNALGGAATVFGSLPVSERKKATMSDRSSMERSMPN